MKCIFTKTEIDLDAIRIQINKNIDKDFFSLWGQSTVGKRLRVEMSRKTLEKIKEETKNLNVLYFGNCTTMIFGTRILINDYLDFGEFNVLKVCK